MRRLALLLIRLYQRHVSPRKGFHCAYRSAGGSGTCSQLGYRVIRRHGLVCGVALLRQRLSQCAEVTARIQLAPPRPPLLQRGDCDPGCAPDIDCGSSSSSCDVFNVCSGCDWPAQKRKRRNESD